MTFKKLILAAGASALAVTPAIANAADAERVNAPVTGEQEIGGGNTLIAVIAVAILATFIALTASEDDDLEPISP